MGVLAVLGVGLHAWNRTARGKAAMSLGAMLAQEAELLKRWVPRNCMHALRQLVTR